MFLPVKHTASKNTDYQ